MKKPIKAREYNLPTKTKRYMLFTKPIKLIKEYLPLIVLLPVIIGGLWQIIELGSMSMSYIRFFSVTQLIADGFLAILVTSPWIFFVYFYVFKYIETNKNHKSDFKTNHSLVFRLFMAIIILVFIVTVYYLIVSKVFHSSNGLINYFSKVFLFFVFFISLDIFVDTLGLLNFLKKNMQNEIFDKPFGLVSLAFIFFIIPMIFHSAFYVPHNLENLEKYNQNKNAELLYFNDKYIFIEHKKEDNKTTIQVVPFEELFNK